jgi:Cu2+-exporting ATPase
MANVMSTATLPDAPSTRRLCAHCGLDALADARTGPAGETYCCAGCETAASIIRSSGLADYYRLPDQRTRRVKPSDRTFAEFDHEAFQRAHVRELPSGLRETHVYLEGVHCASCVWLVERVPLMVPGAVRAELDVTRAVATLVWDPATAALSELARCLDRLGYRPHAYRAGAVDVARRAEERAMLTRIGVAGAIAGNVMTIALALYSGLFSGMEAEFTRYFRWLSFALVTPAILWPGRVFFRSAWMALRAGGLHMDVPIALALGVGYVQGAINTWRNAGPIYFDAVGTLIFLLLLGRYLQHRAQRGAADAAALLGALAPATARVIEDGVVREVPSEAVLPGMELEVRAGDTFAADGIVIAGQSSLDLSMLTGESKPSSVGEGARVYAGTVNLSARLRVRVEEAGVTSRLGKLMRDVEEGTRLRPPVVALADRLAGVFIAVVLVLAIVTAGLWWGRDPHFAIDNAIALLVVTCPCALAMATPLSFTVAIGRAAAGGILIKGGHVLEALTRTGTCFVDKTGTLTEGRLALESWDGPDDVRALVLALEIHSRHPIAEAFRAAWPDVDVPTASAVRETLGGGLEASVRGQHVRVGAPAWVIAQSIRNPRDAEPLAPHLTPVLIEIEGTIVARAGFADPLRADAPRAVKALQRAGWDVRVLSGDSPAVVQSVAERLGLKPVAIEGAASPERKRAVIEAARAKGPVVMIGDGVNDAAAIAAATVGIAVSGGAEASLAAADVYLARGGISALEPLFGGARRTMDIVKRNMLIAVGYNAIGVALAMTGAIDPLFAAVLMPLSSLTVVLGAWQGRTFKRSAS